MRACRTQEVTVAAGVGSGMAGIARSRGRHMRSGFCLHSSIGRTRVVAGRTRRSTDEGVPRCSHGQCRYGKSSCAGAGGGMARLARYASYRDMVGRGQCHQSRSIIEDTAHTMTAGTACSDASMVHRPGCKTAG